MNEISIKGCSLSIDKDKAIFRVPEETPVLGTLLSRFAEGEVLLTSNNNGNLMNLIKFIVAFNGYMEQKGFESCIWIYTDVGYGEAILYQRKNCSVKIVGDEIVLTVTKPKSCLHGAENMKEVEQYLEFRAKTKKVEAV